MDGSYLDNIEEKGSLDIWVKGLVSNHWIIRALDLLEREDNENVVVSEVWVA